MVQQRHSPPPLKPIFVPDLLQAADQTIALEIAHFLPDLETLMPVQGQLTVTHRHSYLAVKADAEVITTLTCNRCLCQYNYRLTVSLEELIWLREAETADFTNGPLEFADGDELVESIPPKGYFEPSQWLYEQLCLALPSQQICDPDCPGIPLKQTGSSPEEIVDQRWSALEILRQQLSN